MMGKKTGPLQRLQLWLAARLGSRYEVAIDLADRAVVAFLVAFGGALVAADVFTVHAFLDVSIWQKALLGGTAAALSLIKSLVVTGITGSPALLSVTSRTLRARRDTTVGERPQHHVPLRAKGQK